MANEDPTGIDEIQLEVLYKQPIQNCYSFDQTTGTATYKEIWKGNFTHVTNTYNSLQNWVPTDPDDYQGYSNFVFAAGGDSKLNYRYSPPTLPFGVNWKLSQVEVNECVAGDNAELCLTWSGQKDPDESDWNTSWNLSWQTKTASLYAYCGNTEAHKDDDAGTMRGKVAQRTAIENWFNLANEYNAAKNNMYYQDNLNKVSKLNVSEQNIAKKIMQGHTQVMYHYPILTITKTIECKKDRVDEILGDLEMLPCDTIQDLSGCPFEIPVPPGSTEWEWLLVQSDVQTQEITQKSGINSKTDKLYRITWTQVGWGAALNGEGAGGWDKNFYGEGNDRWLFGMA